MKAKSLLIEMMKAQRDLDKLNNELVSANDFCTNYNIFVYDKPIVDKLIKKIFEDFDWEVLHKDKFKDRENYFNKLKKKYKQEDS